MALPPEQTGNTGTVDVGHARIDVTDGHVHVTDPGVTEAFTTEKNGTSPVEQAYITQQLLEQILFELKLMNKYSSVILEDLRPDMICEESNGYNN